MNMLNSKTDLSEPIKNLRFWKNTSFDFHLLDALTQIPSISITHDNIEIPIFAYELLVELYYARVVERFENMGLLETFINLLLCHAHDLDLFKDTHLISGDVKSKVAFPIGSLA